MIEKALLEYLQPVLQKNTQLFSLSCPEWILSKKRFLLGKEYVFSIMLVLHTDLIPMEMLFQELDKLFKEIGLNPKCQKKIQWFVLSSRGGIYLYESIAVKEHKKNKKMRNRFIIINTENASVSFGPGHKKNTTASQKLFSLIQNSRFFRREEWLSKMFDFFSICEDTIVHER